MKHAAYALTFALLASPLAAADTNSDGTTVSVLGRSWLVQPVEDNPGYFSAIRDNNNLNPFGHPAKLRSHQAIRAFRAATGCAVDYKSMYQDITGKFVARMNCTQ
ncbi:MAG: hypothetical protein GJ676_02040 [Rhodobacteraceae bacterium]|nr:hypothetical protein [Paracoccaceae bacterium]